MVYTNYLNGKLDIIRNNLIKNIRIYFNKCESALRESSIKLDTLNPAAILSRGYSITRTIPEHAVVHSSEEVSKREEVEVLLAKGKLKCKITEVT